MGISRRTEIRETPAGREILAGREIPKTRGIPGNSRMGNSREGKILSHAGGRECEFPIEYSWLPIA